MKESIERLNEILNKERSFNRSLYSIRKYKYMLKIYARFYGGVANAVDDNSISFSERFKIIRELRDQADKEFESASMSSHNVRATTEED